MVALSRHPIAQLRRLGFQRGVMGGSRKWLGVAIALWLVRATRRALAKSEQIAATEVLLPGQTLTIRTIAPEPRRARS